MNVVMISGKIISDIDFKFMYNREEKARHISIAKCELQLDNAEDSVIEIYGYDDMADYLYRNRQKHVWLEGEIDSNMQMEVLSYLDYREVF